MIAFNGHADFQRHSVMPALSLMDRSCRAQANGRLSAGAESPDRGSQALAFLPNEFWVHTRRQHPLDLSHA